MSTLRISKFSVIHEANLQLDGINVIIGPQASGKSLICKLAAFNFEIASSAAEAISEEVPLDSFKQQVKERFQNWFPVNTWSKEKFEISFENGPFTASVTRTSYKGAIGEKIRLSLSPIFCSAYEEGLSEVRDLVDRSRNGSRSGGEKFSPWMPMELAGKRINKFFSEHQSPYYTYIPAGRAFFTTYGKAISVFESGSLDPVTSRFGKLMEFVLGDRLYTPDRSRGLLRNFDEIQHRILKGRLLSKRDLVRFEAEDGRSLSLSQLSSGTQEVLPLLATLRATLGGFLSNNTVFAEEPEVHLFPSSQVEIVRLFSWMARVSGPRSSWVITTHSPYILSSFNSLIEAGQAARSNPQLREDIAKIVPEQYWIEGGNFKAYAIEDGKLKSILNESGFVEGNYLDQVSETISDEFDRLIKLEYDHAKAS